MKKSLKKGGVAEIVSLMIIVGIVIALIIAVVLPMANNARDRGASNVDQASSADSLIGDLQGNEIY